MYVQITKDLKIQYLKLFWTQAFKITVNQCMMAAITDTLSI